MWLVLCLSLLKLNYHKNERMLTYKEMNKIINSAGDQIVISLTIRKLAEPREANRYKYIWQVH